MRTRLSQVIGPVYDESAMTTRPLIPDAIRAVTNLLLERGATEVYLFGSSAKGTAREDSDLDFAVVGLPPDCFYKTLGEAMFLVNRDIDLVNLDQGGDFGLFLKEHGRLRRVA